MSTRTDGGLCRAVDSGTGSPLPPSRMCSTAKAPRGRPITTGRSYQLLCEAVDYAREHVAAMINEAEGAWSCWTR